VEPEANREQEDAKVVDVRIVARKALLRLLQPLAGFVADSGLSTAEFEAIFREAAVRNAAAKQTEVSNRVNISGIAATTGIPRAEISRILRAPPKTLDGSERSADGHQQSTNRVLAAWHADPKFTNPAGRPADLKVYGRGATFEALAKRHGRGIPTRAILDELLRTGAIQFSTNQKIRAKASMTVDRGMSARVIKAFGDRGSELLSTMLLNMRKPGAPKFIASVADASIQPSLLPLFRKEVSIKGSDFLADVQESLSKRPRNRSKADDHGSAKVSVTIFYHEIIDTKNVKEQDRIKRRNLRRV